MDRTVNFNEALCHTELLFDGTVTVAVYGKPVDWAAKFREGDFSDLARLGKQWGSYALQVPSVREFNALVIGAYDFPKEERQHDITVCHGARADGAVLPLGTGRIILSADCPTIFVRSGEGRVIVAHAGRDCLVDRGRIERGAPTRPHESVVDAVMAKLDTADPRECRARIVYGVQIMPHDPDHPRYGKFNAKFLTEVRDQFGPHCIKDGHGLRLPLLIAEQLARHGVPLARISWDAVDTASDPQFWSQARGERERNCVLVLHHGQRSR